MSVTDLSTTPPAADAYRWGGLGKTAWRVRRALERAGSATMAELRVQLQMNPRTLRRSLGRLHAVGAAELADGVWHPVAVDLQVVARELGTDGAADRQREAHREQRLAYRELLGWRRRRRERSRSRQPPPSETDPTG